MSFTSGFYVGEEVVTRRGKRGVVTAIVDDTMLNVRFGGREFPMKFSQVRSAKSVDSAGKGYAKQVHR